MKIIYKTGLFLGTVLLFIKFFIRLDYINVFSLSFLIIGLSFLFNYYLVKGYKNQYQCWWQNISGYCLVVFGLVTSIKFRPYYGFICSIENK